VLVRSKSEEEQARCEEIWMNKEQEKSEDEWVGKEQE